MSRKHYNSKAIRLSEQMEQEIRAGVYPVGDLLPAEVQLGRRYTAARVTIRRCFDILIAKGLLTRQPHRGVMVNPLTDPPPAPAGRRLTIATLMAARPDEGLSLMQEGIAAWAGEQGHDFQLLSSAEDCDQPFRALAHIEDLGIDGLVVLPYPGDEHFDLLDRLRAIRFPVVCVERRSTRLALPAVTPDNAGGMYRAVQHLIERHGRPVHWIGLTSDHRSDADRLAGWERAMRDAGWAELIASHRHLHAMATSDPAYWRLDEPWRQGYEVARDLLAAAPPPLSIACLKDYVAWGVYRAAEERGVLVGRDLMITGFDDLGFAARLNPPLTSVRQDLRGKGYQAARLLGRVMAGDLKAPVEVVLPVQLTVRGSA